jgi:hypothetical protein
MLGGGGTTGRNVRTGAGAGSACGGGIIVGEEVVGCVVSIAISEQEVIQRLGHIDHL